MQKMKKSVLVVDDDKQILKTFTQILEKAADYGADDFLVKPVRPKVLLDALKTWTSEE
jgi:FixJ family two-component response regulator